MAAPGDCNGRIWKNVSFMTLWDLSKYHTVEEVNWRASEILVMKAVYGHCLGGSDGPLVKWR